MNRYQRITFLCTLAIAVVAIVFSIVAIRTSGRPGPIGPVGPPGKTGATGNTGKAAETARLGICYSTTDDSSLDNLGYDALEFVSVASPVDSNGVYTCPEGMTFVSVAPAPANLDNQ